MDRQIEGIFEELMNERTEIWQGMEVYDKVDGNG